MMTRARRRRLLGKSPEPLEDEPAESESKRRKTEASFVHGPDEWRDWANLLPDLVEDISGRLLSLDVAEYLRFRAICKPWRGLTSDPHGNGHLDSRFRPRGWVVLTITPDARPRRRLLNLATDSSLGVDLPELSTHCHVCAADGLLVLFHQATKVIRLLNPLNKAVIEFPPISRIRAAVSLSTLLWISVAFDNSSSVVDADAINGAGFDDSTSPPTLVLCLRNIMHKIVFAKPGDAYWTPVRPGQASHPMYDTRLGKVLFYSLLSLRGRCYISSPEGSIYLVELSPLPRLVDVVDQRCFAGPENISERRIISFLVGSSGGRMLMVRHWRPGGVLSTLAELKLTIGRSYSRCVATPAAFEVLEVDITGRRLVPVRSLGRHAVFVGWTHCVLISTEIFPSIAADAVYLGYLHQQYRGFSIYHINSKRSNRKTEQRYKFI